MIPLVVGDPRTQPASYTRFVLPFAYTPELCAAPVSGPRSRITNGRLDHDEWRWRHDYFTAETADVLYRHARWARLEDAQPVRFKVRDQTHEIDVEVGRVGLVAFEWPPRGDPADQRPTSRG